MTPTEFRDKWLHSELKESAGSHEHFIDLCNMLGHPTPAEADKTGETFCFERGAAKNLRRTPGRRFAIVGLSGRLRWA